MRPIPGGICILFLLAGCSSAPTPVATSPFPGISPDWSYEKSAINLHIKADPQLNLFNKTPHTLFLCIYHLRDLNSFNQLRDERDGLLKLLECSRFDPSVTYARRMVIQPGQEIRESLDRPDGARFVNVAAGYVQLKKDLVTRSFPVPVAESKRGGVVVKLPQRLDIDLYLGPREIRQVPPAP